MPKLEIKFPDGETITRELTEDTVTVGRIADNDLEINDVSVSSHHAELTLEDGDYHLKDLHSTNGTKVNGERGTDWKLQDGDVITFGKVAASYSSEIPAAKRSLPAAEKRTVELGSQSQRPVDFTNASRFKTKSKKKEPAALAIVALFVLALITSLGALVTVFLIQPPA